MVALHLEEIVGQVVGIITMTKETLLPKRLLRTFQMHPMLIIVLIYSIDPRFLVTWVSKEISWGMVEGHEQQQHRPPTYYDPYSRYVWP